ncbi:uncharacterized protein [Bemisia tabaci]|uniref:uncharacterized protein n=1 Tax=Bemisia tabaci TaxID=7038 RepID=UPI0008F9C2C0|nr:PREDICTED: midkine-B-like [Bemisia tabaci]
MKWWNFIFAVLVISIASALAEIYEETEHEVLVRNVRGVKEEKGKVESCRYEKGSWSECDPKTNVKTRTLTLKKGDQPTCEPTKTVEKECKKSACRYEKGTWSACDPQTNEMARTDTLKTPASESCDKSKRITKKCKNKAQRKNKGNKGQRRNRQ